MGLAILIQMTMVGTNRINYGYHCSLNMCAINEGPICPLQTNDSLSVVMSGSIVDPATIGKGRNSIHNARREEIPGGKK
jgi:hypothetical protein